MKPHLHGSLELEVAVINFSSCLDFLLLFDDTRRLSVYLGTSVLSRENVALHLGLRVQHFNCLLLVLQPVESTSVEGVWVGTSGHWLAFFLVRRGWDETSGSRLFEQQDHLLVLYSSVPRATLLRRVLQVLVVFDEQLQVFGQDGVV